MLSHLIQMLSYRETSHVFNVLPHLRQLEMLDLSGFRFSSCGPTIELLMTKTLRHNVSAG